MSRPKKGQLAQFMIPVRQSSDGSVASTVTASDFNSGATVKFFGANHGGSAATTSGAVSKIASLVKSGVFRITLKGSENNYDEMMLRITKTSLRETLVVWNNEDYTNSDLMSRLSDVASDLRSYLVGLSGALSDVESQLDLVPTVNVSDTVSKVYALLSDLDSNFQSRVPKAVATNSQLSDLHSDLKSYLGVMSGVQLDIYSNLSDLKSDFQSRVPKAVATNSQLSDLHSDLRSFLVVMSGVQSDIYSSLSDIQSDFQSRVPKRVATDSQLSDLASDLKSAIGGITVTIDASDISDISSAVVEAIGAGLASDVASKVLAGIGSDFSDMQSNVNRVFTLLSDFESNMTSRVPKEVAARSQVSDLSSDLRSYLAGISGAVSDLQSTVSDFYSDFQSRVTGTLATRSQVSDIGSDLRSYLVGLSGAISDVESQLDLVPTVNNSDTISKVYALLSDFQSDFASRVPKEVASKSLLSDVQSDLLSYMGGMSGVQSDIYSLLSAGPEIGASSMSDIRSALNAGVGLNASAISDVVSAIKGRTFTEPSNEPTFASTHDEWLAYWAAVSVNKITQTGSIRSIRNSADNADITSMAVSDDGMTFTDGAAG